MGVVTHLNGQGHAEGCEPPVGDRDKVCLYAPRPDTCPGGDAPGTPFRACACSWLFAWHVAWLSVMQLRHYLFIGTLNPQLEHLARGDHALGKAWRRGGHGEDPGVSPTRLMLSPHSEHLHQRLCHHPALRGALCPLERPHPRPAQARKGAPP